MLNFPELQFTTVELSPVHDSSNNPMIFFNTLTTNSIFMVLVIEGHVKTLSEQNDVIFSIFIE
jgi:hypothetical protein